MEYVIATIWAVLIALKIAGVGTKLASISWFVILLWPIAAYLIIAAVIVLVLVVGFN